MEEGIEKEATYFMVARSRCRRKRRDQVPNISFNGIPPKTSPPCSRPLILKFHHFSIGSQIDNSVLNR
jgi:hypothetical protein